MTTHLTEYRKLAGLNARPRLVESEAHTGAIHRWSDGHDYQKASDGMWARMSSKSGGGGGSPPPVGATSTGKAAAATSKVKKPKSSDSGGGGGGGDDDGATHAGSSYASFAAEAEKTFLSHVGKGLKKALGSKLDKVVAKKGASGSAWLELTGEDASDLSYELQVTLHHRGGSDVDVFVWGKHAGKGDVDVKQSLKTGQLTPDHVAKLVSQMLK